MVVGNGISEPSTVPMLIVVGFRKIGGIIVDGYSIDVFLLSFFFRFCFELGDWDHG